MAYFDGKIFIFENVITSIHHYVYLFENWPNGFDAMLLLDHPHRTLLHPLTTPWPIRPSFSNLSIPACVMAEINTGAPSLEVGTQLPLFHLINYYSDW